MSLLTILACTGTLEVSITRSDLTATDVLAGIDHDSAAGAKRVGIAGTLTGAGPGGAGAQHQRCRP